MRIIPNVRHNILANFAGRSWAVLLNFLFVPFYIHYLGIEAYGLIGFYASLTVALMFLDLGLGATLTRELARIAGTPEGSRDSRSLLHTMEIISWCLGLVVGAAVTLSAPFIAHDWLTTKDLPVDTVETAVRLMGLIIALQWPALLYSGGFMGLQRQVRLNVIRMVIVTLQACGAIVILSTLSPTIEAFLLWQAAVFALQAAIMARDIRSIMPHSNQVALFRLDLLRPLWRFAAGVTGISISISILTQMDKLIVGKFVSLDLLGCYTLAFLVANILSSAVSPFQNALFPRFTELFARDESPILAALYHRSCQVVAVAVFPVAAVVIVFPEELLQAWVRDPFTVANTAGILKLVALGSVLNACMALPYTLQISAGWVRLSLYKNLAAIVLTLPGLLWLVPWIGGVGGAIVWLALNLGYYVFEIPIMHRRLLRDEMWRWYLIDTLAPLGGCLALAHALRLAVPETYSGLPMLLAIGLVYTVVLLFTLFLLPHPKAITHGVVRRYLTRTA